MIWTQRLINYKTPKLVSPQNLQGTWLSIIAIFYHHRCSALVQAEPACLENGRHSERRVGQCQHTLSAHVGYAATATADVGGCADEARNGLVAVAGLARKESSSVWRVPAKRQARGEMG